MVKLDTIRIPKIDYVERKYQSSHCRIPNLCISENTEIVKHYLTYGLNYLLGWIKAKNILEISITVSKQSRIPKIDV